MSKRKLGRLGLVAVAPAVFLASASVVHAQYPLINGGYSELINTFDSPSSFVTGNPDQPDNSTNRTYNPPPNWFGYDNGTATVKATNSVTWSSQNNSPDPTLGSPTSGSAKLAWTFNTTADGQG